MDTPHKTFFLVQQQVYDISLKGYDFPSLALFQYDKNSEIKGIEFLNKDNILSSSSLKTVEYSVAMDYLVIGYADGRIDVVYNDGRVVPLNHLVANASIPGATRINRITINPRSAEISVATDAGYLIWDGVDFSIKSSLFTGQRIDAALLVGEKVIIHKNNGIYVSGTLDTKSVDDFVLQSVDMSVSYCFPLDNGSIGYVNGEPGEVSDVMLLREEVNDEWVSEFICRDKFHASLANQAYLNRYEGNFIPCKRGVMFYSSDKIWQLSVDTEDKKSVASILMDKKYSPVASWDCTEFWTYHDRGCFKKIKPGDSSGQTYAQWVEVYEPIRPNVSSGYICTSIAYSPLYGHLTLNHGPEQFFSYLNKVNPTLLSAWDGKKWSLHSHSHHMPAAIENDEAAKRLYAQNVNLYPASDPKGVCVDPQNNDYLFITSMYGGLTVQNLKNIDELPLRFCSPTDPLASFPDSYPIMPDQKWNSFCSLSKPVFDADSTLWFTYMNFVGSESSNQGRLQFKYLTKEKRRELYKGSLSFKEAQSIIGTVNIPYYGDTNSFGSVLAFTHQASSNYLIADGQGYQRPIAIVNHKGTLENEEDDEVKLVYGIETPEGSLQKFSLVRYMVEDPWTGEVVMAFYDGICRFHPGSPVNKEGYIKGQFLNLKGDLKEKIVPQTSSVNHLLFDDYHKLWIATNDQGLICLSADGNRVEYRFTEGNSPLPSNTVYGLGWNPESESLMISTQSGLAELFPDKVNQSESVVGHIPILIPGVVTPDFSGDVYIRHLPENAVIIVRDRQGKEVRNLSSSQGQNCKWDLKDRNGERVESGVYNICVNDLQPLKITVLSPK